MSELNTALETASNAVSGAETPEAVTAKQALDGRLMWALIGAGPALSLLIGLAAWWLARAAGILLERLVREPAPPAAIAALVGQIVEALAFGIYGLIGCLGLVVWRLAGSRRMEVKAGPASLSLDS